MSRKTSIALLVLILLLSPAIYGVADFARFMLRPVAPAESQVISVRPGSSFAQVALLLEERGVVASALRLRLLARWRGEAGRVKAGEYRFTEAALPGQVLTRLVAGDVIQYRFTVPEGLTLQDIAQKLATEGRGDAARFLQLSRDTDFIHSLGLEVETLEGYLYPETYTLVATTGEKQLLQAMVRQMKLRLTEELVGAARARELSVHQLLTLASIIQKEAGNEAEMPVIAGVFHNRLQRGMRLQADPTVIYGVKDFDGNLTRRHLEEWSPYNTYRIVGLPPGPIANPGESALRAAAYPAEVDYLYFVGKGDGTHVFSQTLREHNDAVRRYQLKR
ncbi:endolytic transglycosylase MltG [Desulfuromonas sp. AOP6]|uniref:endolytic transglycosylase MltG n=1 Tax=Desulfuromonas sp. AOP6 TaxID=1566351 RepID=UPI00126B21E5|nr:endolytic transglycosylase MltG [Desulfuromonas sp. AOP6]BCA78479.1 aminodeoxychorismate lyase [Desulfuromonas sp. AOP6]